MCVCVCVCLSLCLCLSLTVSLLLSLTSSSLSHSNTHTRPLALNVAGRRGCIRDDAEEDLKQAHDNVFGTDLNAVAKDTSICQGLR